MIVDDHAGMRLVVRHHVERALGVPFEIIECESGEEAVSAYTQQRPDCVLMDVDLQQMNGLQAAAIIHRYDQNAAIIIVTDHEVGTLRRKAADLPVIGFVSKDNLSELAPIMRALLDK